MPTFSKCCPGADEYLCQVCGRVKCSGCQPSTWRTDITGNKSAGNVCPDCLKAHKPKSDGRPYTILYKKDPSFRETKDLTIADIPRDFVVVKEISAKNMQDAWIKMQGENWSPKGEARPLIEKLGLQHTSMSVGDVMYDKTAKNYWQVCMMGFRRVCR